MTNILLSHLLLPLISAAIFPLIHERPRFVAWLATLITAATAILSAVLLAHVTANGSFRIVFSSTTSAIGIELVISSFSALFALIHKATDLFDPIGLQPQIDQHAAQDAARRGVHVHHESPGIFNAHERRIGVGGFFIFVLGQDVMHDDCRGLLLS